MRRVVAETAEAHDLAELHATEQELEATEDESLDFSGMLLEDARTRIGDLLSQLTDAHEALRVQTKKVARKAAVKALEARNQRRQEKETKIESKLILLYMYILVNFCIFIQPPPIASAFVVVVTPKLNTPPSFHKWNQNLRLQIGLTSPCRQAKKTPWKTPTPASDSNA
jgi:hypothetical protein